MANVQGPSTSIKNARMVMSRMWLGDDSWKRELAGAIMLTKTVIDDCADGGQGFADLVGFRVDEEKMPKYGIDAGFTGDGGPKEFTE